MKDKIIHRIKNEYLIFKDLLHFKRFLLLLLGAAILSFGLYNIHQRVSITEGGVLGLVLLLNHHFKFPTWLLTLILDSICYLLGWKYLGGNFIRLSMLSTLSVSFFLRIWELFPPILPDLSAYPLLAALLGGVFVGIGVGFIIRQGGSSGGDDALALVISKKIKCRISIAYLFTDLTVLFLSLSYIPMERIIFSLITVTISSLLIEWIQK